MHDCKFLYGDEFSKTNMNPITKYLLIMMLNHYSKTCIDNKWDVCKFKLKVLQIKEETI